MADQLLIIGIGQFEPVIRPDQQRHEPRRMGKHLGQMIAIDPGFLGLVGDVIGQALSPKTAVLVSQNTKHGDRLQSIRPAPDTGVYRRVSVDKARP
jgi:hypothetical protein